MPCTGLCKATGLGRACPSLCKWMHQLGSEAVLRLSTPEHDKGSNHLWLEAWRGYEVLALVAPGCCGSVAQSLEAAGTCYWGSADGAGWTRTPPAHPCR